MTRLPQKGVPRLGTYTHTMLPPVWWYAQSAVELSWSDESRSSTRMCVLLVEGYLLQRTRDKRRAINMSPTWSRSRVVMSPGETPRDRYHPISQSDRQSTSALAKTRDQREPLTFPHSRASSIPHSTPTPMGKVQGTPRACVLWIQRGLRG